MSGPVVVVTGASSGIGRCLALNLASKPSPTGPYRLLLVARREEELKTAVDECNKAAGAEHARYFAGDVTRRADVEAAAEAAKTAFGRIDVWVNNAGRGITRSTMDLSDEDVTEMMQVNVNSALYGMQTAVKVFQSQSPAEGQIVNVSSVLGRNAARAPLRSAYSASKHFLNALTDALRCDMKANDATRGIVISLFSPGLVATGFGNAAVHGGPDSRKIPRAQSVESCAEALRVCIEEKREEMYSLPEYKQQIVDFIASKA
jgi:NAD(P)-dependent dehydrogenase (short-subunit alcohol dehydrogenase family)